LGVPDKFIEHGTPNELIKECGYNSEGIFKAISALIERKVMV
jgi:1-deoxy-D-xylulose-5-phosphate synthase